MVKGQGYQQIKKDQVSKNIGNYKGGSSHFIKQHVNY
jgi:hypothetical protein